MRKIGSYLFIFGVAAVIFGFMNRVPRLLIWIYEWGETVAWAIKIGFIVAGAALYLLGNSNEEEAETEASE